MRQGEYSLPRLMPHKGDSFIEARRILARQSVLLGGSHDRLRKRLVENSSPLSPLRNLASTSYSW